MADHSVGARDESNGSEVSEALMFCFDNAFPEKSYFRCRFGPFVSSSLRVFVFLNATATEWNLPQQRKCAFFQFPRSLSEEKARSSRLKFMLESILEVV